MQKISLTQKLALNHHLIMPIFENDVDIFDYKNCTGFSRPSEFKAELGEIYTTQHATNHKKRWLLGLGKRNGAEQLINPFRKLVNQINRIPEKIVVNAEQFNEDQLRLCMIGIIHAGYTLKHYKKDANGISGRDIEIYAPQKFAKKAYATASAIAAGSQTAMDLVNLPSNIKDPSYLADFTKKLGSKLGFGVKVVKGNALLKTGLKALYEVGKGSEREAAFIIIEYKPAGKIQHKIGLIGKGITFDTGGISLKSSNNMHLMKSDMGGAAAVIGSIEAASRLSLPVHLIGIIPAAENAIGSRAYKPGDVIGSYSGKSIEIIDTDAEGRLVLADGLSYMVKNYQPQCIVDLATLTGSCVATLGYTAAGMFTQNDELASELYQAGCLTGEKVWRLPLWDDYKNLMASDIADIKNLSSVPIAGAITAAKFLEAFTEDHKSWVHLDIAGVSFTDSEFYKSRTATGYGVRLLTHWLQTKCQ
ncbi:MAG: leucyl aminopeptidase family protein [Saprospiraceae bacterium]